MRKLALLVLALLSPGACASSPAPVPSRPGPAAVPLIRVRLVAASAAASVRLACAGPYRVLDGRTGAVLESGASLSREVALRGAAAGSVRIEADAAPLSVDGTPYPGALLLRPAEGGNVVLVETDVEHYLPGVLAGELGASFPAAALRAQAVAARTWALDRVRGDAEAAWHVNDDTSSQRFLGRTEPAGGPLTRAVADTAGMVLLWRGRLFPAYFHSTCGGRTASAADVWGGPSLPPLAGVPCAFCAASPRYRWSVAFPLAEAAARLGLPGPPAAVEFADLQPDGRARTLRFRGASEASRSAATVRDRLDPARLPSTFFSAVRVEGSRLVFEGAGYGHGVGMCQWGAVGMARAGAGPADILAHYYPAAALSRIY